MSKLGLLICTLAGCIITLFSVSTYDESKAKYVSLNDIATIVAEYPHSTTSFTQGLFFYNGDLYETTGRYGESNLYKNININNGKFEKSYLFDSDIFAEGAVALDGTVYVLTYKENTVFTFTPEELTIKSSYEYPYEGWGLTTDGEHLIASDGTDNLRFFDKNLKLINTVKVTIDGKSVDKINELEYINGKIYANRWLTNDILVISPQSGEILAVIDASTLAENQSGDINDVLNGIAYNKDNGRLYLTGKRWDTLFELEFK